MPASPSPGPKVQTKNPNKISTHIHLKLYIYISTTWRILHTTTEFFVVLHTYKYLIRIALSYYTIHNEEDK